MADGSHVHDNATGGVADRTLFRFRDGHVCGAASARAQVPPHGGWTATVKLCAEADVSLGMEKIVVFFRNSPRPRNEQASRLGFRSPLVLAKLGFDLRDHYEEALSQPLPDALRRPLDQLEAPASRPERRLGLREHIGALTRPGAWRKLRAP
jgi:hypothetical protein